MAKIDIMGNSTTSKTATVFNAELKDGALVIVIPDIEEQLGGKEANANGNRVLNVYHKISSTTKFSGNLIYKG